MGSLDLLTRTSCRNLTEARSLSSKVYPEQKIPEPDAYKGSVYEV